MFRDSRTLSCKSGSCTYFWPLSLQMFSSWSTICSAVFTRNVLTGIKKIYTPKGLLTLHVTLVEGLTVHSIVQPLFCVSICRNKFVGHPWPWCMWKKLLISWFCWQSWVHYLLLCISYPDKDGTTHVANNNNNQTTVSVHHHAPAWSIHQHFCNLVGQ